MFGGGAFIFASMGSQTDVGPTDGRSSLYGVNQISELKSDLLPDQ
jgi:hypothetical protein